MLNSTFERGETVELKNKYGVRLNVLSVNADMITLGFFDYKNPTVVCEVNVSEVVKIQPTKFVWMNLTNGVFSDTWVLDRHVNRAYMDSLLEHHKKMDDNDNVKLIEYTCYNDEQFEICNLMKLK